MAHGLHVYTGLGGLQRSCYQARLHLLHQGRWAIPSSADAHRSRCAVFL